MVIDMQSSLFIFPCVLNLYLCTSSRIGNSLLDGEFFCFWERGVLFFSLALHKKLKIFIKDDIRLLQLVVCLISICQQFPLGV